jgi:hypothetical protein
MNSQAGKFQECQRVQVTRDTQGSEQVVRITVERHDVVLGWYTAGALSLPLCQLPVLEQALSELSPSVCDDCTEASCARKIIPFPLLATSANTEAIAERAS